MSLKLKRIVLYRFLQLSPIDTVLDFGCGTGGQCRDMERIARGARVVGLTISTAEVEEAQRISHESNSRCEFRVVPDEKVPFPDETFTKIFTSDVLGHVKDYRVAVAELFRVCKRGGRVAVFTETQNERFAFLNNYLLRRGINTDPHAEFHISLYPSDQIQQMFHHAGFRIVRVLHPFVLRFLTYPQWYHPFVHNNPRVHLWIRVLIGALYRVYRLTRPFYEAAALVVSYAELVTIARVCPTQGMILLVEKP